MGGLNVGRWLGGGLSAGLLIWVFEGAASVLYMDEMEATLAAHDLAMELSPAVMAGTVLVSLIVGLTIVFFYAGVRPRFGPGPKTAALVGVVLWIGGYLVSLVGYGMIGLYSTGLLVTWGLVGLVEMILAALLGGWIYREASGPA